MDLCKDYETYSKTKLRLSRGLEKDQKLRKKTLIGLSRGQKQIKTWNLKETIQKTNKSKIWTFIETMKTFFKKMGTH